MYPAPDRSLGHPASPQPDVGDPGRRPACSRPLHDRDAKFSPSFDAVFRGEGLAAVQTAPRRPQENGVAERWVRSARRECLDHLLILNERHLLRVLRAFVTFYNE